MPSACREKPPIHHRGAGGIPKRLRSGVRDHRSPPGGMDGPVSCLGDVAEGSSHRALRSDVGIPQSRSLAPAGLTTLGPAYPRHRELARGLRSQPSRRWLVRLGIPSSMALQPVQSWEDQRPARGVAVCPRSGRPLSGAVRVPSDPEPRDHLAFLVRRFRALWRSDRPLGGDLPVSGRRAQEATIARIDQFRAGTEGLEDRYNRHSRAPQGALPAAWPRPPRS